MDDTVFPIEEFQALVHPLIGLPVALPWKGYGSAISLELGRLAPLESGRQHHNEGEACIMIEWDWRVECGASVLYGSSNGGPKIERGIGPLSGTRVQGMPLVGEVPELVVHFSNGHRLRSMVMVTGDPRWHIKLPSGSWVYAKAGTLLVGEGGTGATEEEYEASELAEWTAKRWGVPRVEPAPGRCADCAWFVRIDGEGHLLDYGVCIASTSPFDGRVVMLSSGCPSFTRQPG